MSEIGQECAFAVLGFRANVAADVPANLVLGPDATAHSESPMPIDGFWRDTLGSMRVQEWTGSNLFMQVSSTRELNERALSRTATGYLYGLLVHEASYINGGLLLAGSRLGSRYDVRLAQPLYPYPRPRGVLSRTVDQSLLLGLAPWVSGLLTVYSHEGTDAFLRLRKGCNALLGAKLESRDDVRIHQYVRAVEAVIRPTQGNTRRQFVHRCQLFAGRNTQARDLLAELFDLRSTAEHMNPIADLYVAARSDVRDKTVAERTYQAELLADYVYQRLFSGPELLAHFLNDATSERLWSRPDHELEQIWPDTIDLTDHSAGHFRADMINVW